MSIISEKNKENKNWNSFDLRSDPEPESLFPEVDDGGSETLVKFIYKRKKLVFPSYYLMNNFFLRNTNYKNI